MKRLALGSLGGTLSMRGDAAEVGIVPKVSAQMLVDAVPGLATLASVQAHTLGLSPSASMSWVDVLAARDWADTMVGDGADGVVITQGTDTLEESAYLLDLLWPHPQPLVLTGAMRGADAAGADGPGNVLAAAVAALDPRTSRRGVVVAMLDRLYAADQVRKVHSLDLDAFQSPGHGCIGSVQEGKCRYAGPAPERPVALAPTRVQQRVALLEATLGEGPELLHSVLESGCEGVVVAAMGAGHVPSGWVEPLARAAVHRPIIIASRTGAGATARHTYGFAGGEIHLQRRGLLMAGSLCPRKCRLLLWALIGSDTLDSLQERLQGYGGGMSNDS
ncbi:asparaginase [Stenotrophomonas indicatrix]|uniref:asparaginase n=1 Tax=Stenotrophomonas indicatrix TaxID=2045451 RepID=UPI00131308E1|nr:asparaginase [Stenotrophomonas indicatrix]